MSVHGENNCVSVAQCSVTWGLDEKLGCRGRRIFPRKRFPLSHLLSVYHNRVFTQLNAQTSVLGYGDIISRQRASFSSGPLVQLHELKFFSRVEYIRQLSRFRCALEATSSGGVRADETRKRILRRTSESHAGELRRTV